jgi:hypothetical protein
MVPASEPVLRIGGRSIPVVPPSIHDPRLHLAAVIISIHVLGQTSFGFRVSVPQILAAIVTCAVIEITWTLATIRRLVWPASAMLTGSGVALIFRVLDTPRGDHWTWHAWHLFAIVAGASLLTKYIVRYRGSHVFNPSNAGLVAAFLILGSARVAPLDFWWAPLTATMAIAYLLIVGGGVAITARLGLLGMAMTFWAALCVGLGVLAGSGHCFIAEWSLDPVCGGRFWWVVATSPELLVFLFFMITDPKTIPAGRPQRIGFAVLVAGIATLLIAPQTTEFGAKVGLLGGLVIASPTRYLIEPNRTPTWARRMGAWIRDAVAWSDRPAAMYGRGIVAGAVAVGLAVVIVVAGGPARLPAQALSRFDPPDVRVDVDPANLPPVTMDAPAGQVQGFDEDGVEGVALVLAENLEIEARAVETGDAAILRGADFGERLAEMEDAVASAGESAVPAHHAFDSLHVRVVFSEGTQAGPSLAFDARGTVIQGDSTIAFATTFVLRRSGGDRWLIVSASPLE